MKTKTRFPSITIRLFSTILLSMLFMSCLTIYITTRLKDTTQESVVRDLRQVQMLYVSEILQTMNLAQERISELGTSYTTAMATSAEAAKDDRQYEVMRCRTDLTITLRTWKIHYPLVHGYYVYGQEADMLALDGNGYATYNWFSKNIRGTSDEVLPFFRQSTGWQLLDSDMGQLLIFNYVRHDLRYGAWFQLDHLWSDLGLNVQDGQYSIVPLDAPSPTDLCIDIPLGTTEYMVRQLLPEDAVHVPQSVMLLMYLSYAMLLLVPVSWLVLQKLVIRPLRELTKAISEIERGNVTYRIPEKSTSHEFDQLNRQFNQSLETIARTESQVYETHLENERTRIRYLTQQMQPHFVLNTLNLIYSMEPSQYKLMQSTIQCLSRYYRYVAHINEPLVPIESELEHVKNYFQLQQIRYPDNFTYTIECPDELLEFYIPPIVIQTFAENAIKHSLVVGELNQVDVQIVQVEDHRIHISIHDSGSGYPADVLERIHAFQRDRTQREGLGLGIQNTIERLDLLYESGTDLCFSNNPQGGAQVDIFLPEHMAPRRHKMS